MFTAKKRGYFSKNQAFVTILDIFWSNSQTFNRDEEMQESLTLSKALNKPTIGLFTPRSSNLGPNITIF